MTTKLKYLMTAYYTPHDDFTPNDASFYKNEVGQLHYTLQCLFNQLFMLILKLLRGTTVLLYEFVAKQQEKGTFN